MTTDAFHRLATAYRRMPCGGAALRIDTTPYGFAVSNGTTTVGPAFTGSASAALCLHRAGFVRRGKLWTLGPARVEAAIETAVNPAPFYGLRGD